MCACMCACARATCGWGCGLGHRRPLLLLINQAVGSYDLLLLCAGHCRRGLDGQTFLGYDVCRHRVKHWKQEAKVSVFLDAELGVREYSALQELAV